MITDLIKSFMFDKLDSQITKKLPYCLMIAFLIFLIAPLSNIVWPEFLNYQYVIITLFIIFLSTNIAFNHLINKFLSHGLIEKLDLKSTVGRIKAIYEGKSSILDDLDSSKSAEVLVLGFVSGISLTLFLTSMFLAILYNIPEEHLTFISLLGILFTALYVYYDLGKSPLDDVKESPKNSFFADIFEMYIIKNSVSRTGHSEAGLFLAGRLIGPITNLQIPRHTCDNLLVYENSAVDDAIRELIEGKDKILLKNEGGLPFDSLIKQSKEYKGEKISILAEKSQKENFPYLLNPEYQYNEKDQKKWSAFSIIEKSGKKEKIVGRVFIHQFRAVYVKRRIRRVVESETGKRSAYLFTFIGLRSYIQYITTKIDMVTTRVPTQLLDIEFDEKIVNEESAGYRR
jgi:hypothetical protein